MGSQKYRTIVADPPWKVHQPPVWTNGKNRSLPYPTMSLGEIAALPVGDLTEDDAHLYVWTINRYVEATYHIVREWGFRPSTLLVWCKQPIGMGVGGAYALTAEYVVFARKGRGAFQTRHPTCWWTWPRGQHSAKPDAFLDIVEQVSPGPYCELFSRRARLGWDYRWHDGDLVSVDSSSKEGS